jgi:hypothetical protein
MASPVVIIVEVCTSYVGANANPRNYQVRCGWGDARRGKSADAGRHPRLALPAICAATAQGQAPARLGASDA